MEHFNWLAVIFCLYKVIIAAVLFLFYSKICEQFTCIELIGKMSIAYIFQYLQNLNEHFYLCFVTLWLKGEMKSIQTSEWNMTLFIV